MNDLEALRQEAYELGVQAAKNAASWCVDGNTTTEHIRVTLEMLEDGDSAVDSWLPAYPTLDGFALDHSQAWEDGVSDAFYTACESELLLALGKGSLGNDSANQMI